MALASACCSGSAFPTAIWEKGRKLLMDRQRWSIVHIPGHEEVDSSATVDVFAAHIQGKLASVLIKELSVVFPLTDLSHIKRIRSKRDTEGPLSIILCTRTDDSSTIPSQVAELVEKHSLETFIAKIPKHPAADREEWATQCNLWPTTFHPNSARPSKIQFNEDEERTIAAFMVRAMHQASLAIDHGRLSNGAVIVDPSIGQVIASGYDESTPPSCTDCSSCSGGWHPLRHAAMVAIEQASERDRRLFPDDKECDEATLSVKRQRCEASAAESIHIESRSSSITVEASRPYLCTGFDIYLTREPCAMCAMAMVHQRFRRVIFRTSNPDNGALGGKFFLHRQPSLNHHYTVIQATLAEDNYTD
ncbi:probable inactive tRNA-specific adenosine deaminase-like protein 3 [Selaginella moellendorffii]|nr:probable inactive tRNA-specific adenosine deaminase-like protein 3 [Selaginella moellendorffii]|eukprot:XP_002964311.2 probable inactive tRNA-specific adenosine deaminase-like protein 3 [Selaginella moellendorffii]